MTMTKYHAVMLDETGCEFGVEVEASSRAEAYDILEEDYPESRVDQLESPEQSAERQRRIEERAEREYEGDFSDGQWDYEREWG